MTSAAGKPPWKLAAFWGTGLGFGALLAWLWPRLVSVRGDDFGYLESVVLTVQRGRPVSSEWLEPFNRVLPSLSAAGWWLTGDFSASTLGVLALVAAAVYVLGWSWLRPMLPAGWPGHLTVLAVALCPIWLNKAVEYTGISLGLGLFLGALLAWRHSRPVLFHVLVIVAVLNRQSAVCLLALPMWSWWHAVRRGERPDRTQVWSLVVTLIVVALLVGMQPDNLARSLAARRMAHRDWAATGWQALLGLALLGGMAAFWSLLRGEPVGVARRRTDLGLALGWLVVGALLSYGAVKVQCETALLGRVDMLLVPGAALLAALAPGALARVSRGELAAAGLFAALMAWRGIWWDYYLLEPALLLACGRMLPDPAPGKLRAAALAIGLLLAMLAGVPPVRYQVRWTENSILAYEPILRSGRIGIREASDAPFGFLGWKLFPVASRAPEGMTGLTDFLGYVESGRSRQAGEGLLLFNSVEPVRSLHPSGRLRPLPAGYQDRLFPLNSAEWRELLGAQTP